MCLCLTGTSPQHSAAAEPWASLCSSQALCRIRLRPCLGMQQLHAHRIRALDFNLSENQQHLAKHIYWFLQEAMILSSQTKPMDKRTQKGENGRGYTKSKPAHNSHWNLWDMRTEQWDKIWSIVVGSVQLKWITTPIINKLIHTLLCTRD